MDVGKMRQIWFSRGECAHNPVISSFLRAQISMQLCMPFSGDEYSSISFPPSAYHAYHLYVSLEMIYCSPTPSALLSFEIYCQVVVNGAECCFFSLFYFIGIYHVLVCLTCRGVVFFLRTENSPIKKNWVSARRKTERPTLRPRRSRARANTFLPRWRPSYSALQSMG